MKFEMIPYHESAALSTSKAYNAMSWPGGAAISLCTFTLPLTLMYLWSVHCESALMQK